MAGRARAALTVPSVCAGSLRAVRIPATLLALVAAFVIAGCSLSDDPEEDGASRAPDPGTPATGVKSDQPRAAAELGFPTVATKNTTRVSGGDAASDVAGAVSAVWPASSERQRPAVVALVDKDDWQGALAASVLNAAPVRAPTLLSDGPNLPQVSSDTLERLKPKGSQLTKGAQVVLVGPKPRAPKDFKPASLNGKDPYELAAAIDRFFSARKGKPSDNVIVTTGERAPYAMPAAAWAARSGDSILFVKQNEVPPATQRALAAHERPNIYVLGPEEAVSERIERQLSRFGEVERVAGKDPVENALEFARFSGRGGFGWDANQPGRNLTVANTDRPLDLAAGAVLGTNGIFAPLLLTDRADPLPKPLDGYFLDIQPGYEDDPRDAVYNHVWILGDTKTLSPAAQDRIDEVSSLIPVQLPDQ
jgi:ell wall binding domain 2 (CWB2)